MSKTNSKEAEYVIVRAKARPNTRTSEVIHIARIRLFIDIYTLCGKRVAKKMRDSGRWQDVRCRECWRPAGLPGEAAR
jgi:hypothetical protein